MQESKMQISLKIFKGSVMKKWLCVYLLVNVVFAKNSLGIFDNYFTNEEKMRESLAPSFNCDLESNSEVEVVICCAASCGMTREPTVIFLDNFFTSYYHLIMQHTPKDRKQEVKKIAKEAMKQRETITICKEALSSAAVQLCSQQTIANAYEYGIQELTKYVSIYNPKLLDSVFSQYAKEIENFKVNEYLRVELLDKLYIDNIIDETGRLIVKVDSK